MLTQTQQISTENVERTSYAELSALYDRIYDIADRLIKKYNPCNIHIKTLPAKDLYFNPIFPNKLITDTYCNSSHSRGQLCCMSCKYWNKGCTVKALGCKLFLCQSVKNKVLRKRFRKLREYGRKYLSFDFYDYSWKRKCNYSIVDKYFRSKEDWLKLMENKL